MDLKKINSKEEYEQVLERIYELMDATPVAVFPPNLIKPCILAGCPRDGIVLDPFTGSGTTGIVCAKYGRDFVGIELNPEYVKMAERRINQAAAQGMLPL